MKFLILLLITIPLSVGAMDIPNLQFSAKLPSAGPGASPFSNTTHEVVFFSLAKCGDGPELTVVASSGNQAINPCLFPPSNDISESIDGFDRFVVQKTSHDFEGQRHQTLAVFLDVSRPSDIPFFVMTGRDSYNNERVIEAHKCLKMMEVGLAKVFTVYTNGEDFRHFNCE